MIYNLGSINADFFYSVPHLPRSGETLSSTEFTRDLGGKGANMSIAAARAGRRVLHIGAVGEDGHWAIDALRAEGIETQITILPGVATGNAVILRDADGENAIVTLSGANGEIDEEHLRRSLDGIGPDDVFMLQNETVLGREAVELAATAGAHVVYAAAPFLSQTVHDVLPFVDTLVLNEVEMADLRATLNVAPNKMSVSQIVVTQGARGATLFRQGEEEVSFPAPPVDVVDTTGAGDTLTGYLAAGVDAGKPIQTALHTAMRAASIMVTKKGTASAIPAMKEVKAAELRTR
ncbi:MAG: ribokinase [Pseudomonadota bacterium]